MYSRVNCQWPPINIDLHFSSVCVREKEREKNWRLLRIMMILFWNLLFISDCTIVLIFSCKCSEVWEGMISFMSIGSVRQGKRHEKKVKIKHTLKYTLGSCTMCWSAGTEVFQVKLPLAGLITGSQAQWELSCRVEIETGIRILLQILLFLGKSL